MFLETATTIRVLSFLIDLIVQEVLVFAMVQDLPPAVTLLPVIFEPPTEVGNAIVTVTLTLPFLGVDDEIEVMVGAEGLAVSAFT